MSRFFNGHGVYIRKLLYYSEIQIFLQEFGLFY